MKKLFCIILLVLTTCGCHLIDPPSDTGVLFSSYPIGRSAFINAQPEKIFKKGQKIFFIVATNKDFPSQEIRIQILKNSDKANHFGWSLEHARDLEINIKKRYFTNSFHIYNDGHYIFRVFTRENKKKPIAQNNFRVL